MLVLTRKADDQILGTLPDGRPFRIVICSAEHNKVKIGLDAPADVAFIRDNAKVTHKQKGKEHVKAV